MTRLRPVPQPPEVSDAQPSHCLSCRKLKRMNGQLRRQLLLVCRNFMRTRIGALAERERLHRAVQRESHHYDARAANTDRPTRERLTNGRPVAKGE